jgi:hypothetical protein
MIETSWRKILQNTDVWTLDIAVSLYMRASREMFDSLGQCREHNRGIAFLSQCRTTTYTILSTLWLMLRASEYSSLLEAFNELNKLRIEDLIKEVDVALDRPLFNLFLKEKADNGHRLLDIFHESCHTNLIRPVWVMMHAEMANIYPPDELMGAYSRLMELLEAVNTRFMARASDAELLP